MGAFAKACVGLLRLFVTKPEGLLVSTFALLILAGGVALRLPISHRGDKPVEWIDALFTSTSAVCVTGLTSVDTEFRYSRIGHVFIMLLIQLGGLGVMTFAVIMVRVVQVRVSLGSQAALSDSFFQNQSRGELLRSLRLVVLMTLALEFVGALLIYVGLQRAARPGDAFEAAFTAVSAFCNAGFGLRSDNLVSLRDQLLVTIPVMGLITLGGLGYTVLFEIAQRTAARLRGRAPAAVLWTLNTRLVLIVSGVLTFGGAAVLMATGLTERETTLATRLHHALFQSVSARTAGFNTIDIGAMPVASLLILIGLMFIGGSPGSCAGGVKTTTGSVWGAGIYSRLLGLEDVTLFGRRIPAEVVRRAGVVIALGVVWNLAGILVLSVTERVGNGGPRLEQVIFEQVSAFGTVGLSTGITFNLSPAGKVWIMLTMFLGRLGPLTIALLVLARAAAPRYKHPVERVMIG